MQANRSTDDDTGESSQPRRKSNSADVRKQRKRDTDRIAQREHRKRQRQYVQDLEVELAFLKQQPSHSQISQLCEENKQLRQEVNCYRQTILSIQSLIADETQAQVRPGGTASLTLSSPARASIAGAFTSPGSPSTDRARIDAVDAVHAVDAVGAGANEEEASPASGVPAESQPAFSITPPPTVAHNTQPVLHNIMYTDSGVDSNAALWLNDFRSPGSMRGLLDVDQFASGPHVTGHASSHQGMLWRFDLPHAANSPGPGPGPSPDRPAHDACSWLLNLTPPTPSYLMRTSPQDPDLPPQATAQAPAASGLPLHRMISCISTMPKPNDNGIYGIIDKVRSQSLSTPLSREKPTLAEFLLDNSSNMLSESLKEYLEAYRRSDKKSTFLAVYWTIYTLLVWHVYQTRETFERIPYWLRPTEVQIRIPHPVCIDFIAWPALRDALVRLSQVDCDKVCEVMSLMFTHMEVNIETSLIHDLSNEKRVCGLISDLRSWSLRKEFFDTFPEFRGLCLVC